MTYRRPGASVIIRNKEAVVARRVDTLTLESKIVNFLSDQDLLKRFSAISGDGNPKILSLVGSGPAGSPDCVLADLGLFFDRYDPVANEQKIPII